MSTNDDDVRKHWDRAEGTLPEFLASLLLWTLCLVVVSML